jgi:hypothetical protein
MTLYLLSDAIRELSVSAGQLGHRNNKKRLIGGLEQHTAIPDLERSLRVSANGDGKLDRVTLKFRAESLGAV